jgi:ATP-dependent protease ClpP protease subunit
MSQNTLLTDLITIKNVDSVITKLQQQLDNGIKNPILEIDSGGGDISCMKLFYFLLEHPEIITRVIDRCKSAAITVFLAGEVRECLPNSEFLLHMGTMGPYSITPEHYFDTDDWRKHNLDYVEMKLATANRLKMSE